MKTNNEIIDSIESTFRKSGCALTNVQQAVLVGCIFIWLEKVREEKDNTRVKELTSMGEFKTAGEAMEYCRLHGAEISAVDGNLFQIAGAIMSARNDQDKIAWSALDTVLSDVEYNSETMGCGLEDLYITDRYEAMKYGFNEAIRMVDEVTLNEKPA